MSEPPIPSDPSMPPLSNQRKGCVQVFAVLIGLVMLLPGVCGIIIAGLDPHELMVDPNTLLALLGLISIGVGGVALIWWALRRPKQ